VTTSCLLAGARGESGTNEIASVGQTPPQVWQKVQFSTRVPKSGWMASNGQTSMHFPHAMQGSATCRLKRRSKLGSDSSAPLGQT
jgi:hypothetical protein